MKTHDELMDDVARLEAECRTLEIAAMDRGQTPKGRPTLGSNATTEQLVNHIAFLESHAADLRVNDRLSRPLKGVSSSAKTLTEIAADSVRLRAKLEANHPGSTAEVAKLDDERVSANDIDAVLGESKALKAIESSFSTQRQATSTKATSTKPLAQQLRDGDVTAAQINKASEIRRVESDLATAKPGTVTHRALTTKVANLRAEFERLPKPTPKN